VVVANQRGPLLFIATTSHRPRWIGLRGRVLPSDGGPAATRTKLQRDRRAVTVWNGQQEGGGLASLQIMAPALALAPRLVDRSSCGGHRAR
jgi:hypothetical protein